ncbi:MAG TPA: TonB-dependent receptor [Bacteroidales bacterium]|nr:TonB-dependent receptor [Bacteroidales bacterium]
MKKQYVLFLLFTLLLKTLSAQDIPVSGKVTSASDGKPIPGVNVVVKGSSKGTISDINGNYSMQAPADGVLIFSFIGMQTLEIPVDGKRQINVTLSDAEISLGEVVVVGYSTSSKKLISSSIDLVNEQEIDNIPLKTIDGVLQGQVAGLTVNLSSGTPGAQSSIKLRGGSSINASNQPLMVIDGIPVITGEYAQISYLGQETNAMTDINPNDIESVTVLKDASAAAIYGARASNGVILITTKKGNRDRTDVNLNFYYGWQTIPEERLIPMMNAAEWNEYKGTDVQGIDTDWMSEILQAGPASNTELSVSSGNDKLRMFISGNQYSQVGAVKGTDYKRYNGRLNVDYKIVPNLMIGGGASVSYSDNSRVEGDQTLYGPLPNAMSIPAIFPVYDAEGNYDESGPYANPVAIANETVNKAYTNRTNGNVYLEYKFLNGFMFTSKFGADLLNLREHEYDPITVRQGAKYNGLGIEATSYVSNLVSNNVLQYIKSKNDIHNFDALVGYSFEKYNYRDTYIEAIDFPNEQFQYIESAGTIRAASSSALNRFLNSYFGQFRYNYKYKYIFSLSARADGSSKFGKNNHYGYFPAASFAWRMSEEPFIKGVSFINELKLRASYGITGNDGISDFASLGLYGGGYNYGGNSGTAPVQLPNPDLKWETTSQTGIGLDISVAESRVNLTADLYYNHTSDLLLARPIPASSGYYSISSNIGTMENKGVELLLNTVNIDREFTWNSSLNFSLNRNKVLSLYEDQPIDDLGRGGNRVEVGEPIGIFYGYNCLGVDPTTGNLVYEDISGDGMLTADDRTKTGDPNPDFIMGFTNVFRYRSLELSVFLHWVQGREIFNGTFIYLESGTGEDNQTKRMIDRWKKPGDITDFPRVGDTYLSSRFIEDGSYLRIKNVTLSYTFNPDRIRKVGMKSARVYATVQNLFTFTNYLGMDPEVDYYGGSSSIIQGTDFFTYPQCRQVLFGFNIGF